MRAQSEGVMDDREIVLGIDAGGTHTDAVVCRGGRILGRAKVDTNHENLPFSIDQVITKLMEDAGAETVRAAARVTLGTTLIVNAEVQGRLDPVGLVLSAGPGLSPLRSRLGEYVTVVPGGLDHRGVEVQPLDLSALRKTAAGWHSKGVNAFACIGKFSPRNPAHEMAMADEIRKAVPDASVTLGHRLSGELNYPRRIATAYYNAASARLHNEFLDAVEGVLAERGIKAPVFLLKVDGGAVPLDVSRRLPVQSILSGPAASVMGVMALAGDLDKGCALLFDIGGTTTDIALFLKGSPVIDRGGMRLGGRRTLVPALATLSIGVGGDSRISVEGKGAAARVDVGPLRTGPAMAFGGSDPTFLDALNVLNEDGLDAQAGDSGASAAAMASLAAACGLDAHGLAQRVWQRAVQKISGAASGLLEDINAHPIYTLAELKSHKDAAADRTYLVGGPTECLKHRLSSAMGMPVTATAEADVANAVGAALTSPTSSLEIYADTGRKELLAPSLDLREPLPKGASLESVSERACSILKEHLAAEGVEGVPVEVTEADMFATLNDSGYGSKDIRVTCQAVPGILARVKTD